MSDRPRISSQSDLAKQIDLSLPENKEEKINSSEMLISDSKLGILPNDEQIGKSSKSGVAEISKIDTFSRTSGTSYDPGISPNDEQIGKSPKSSVAEISKIDTFSRTPGTSYDPGISPNDEQIGKSPKLSLAEPLKSSTFGSVSVTSNKLKISYGDNSMEFVFDENVKLNSPEFSLECKAAKILTSGKLDQLSTGVGANLDSIQKISITGPLSLKYGEQSCSAESAEITTHNSTAILLGKAIAHSAMGTVSGNEIRINYKTKSVEIFSTPETESVSVHVANPSPALSPKIVSEEGKMKKETPDNPATQPT